MKIAWLSDLDLKGSGYANISIPVCSGLMGRGHDVMVVGLGYKSEEHHFPFSLLPANNLREATATAINLQNVWNADVIVVALDIPLQEQIMNHGYLRDRKMKYVGIFPLEATPLCVSWSMILMQMDKCLVISEFGTEEARNNGIEADHMQVGIDTESWKQVTLEEKIKMRGSFGFDEDTFVVLTVADNQERKNLVAAMDIFAKFAKDKDNVKYMLVTREHNRVGWKLRDYASEIGISDKFMIFERGMDHKQLWTTYAVSDAFLLTSKAEGLGLPLLEAMAVGLPCIATDCTGMAELLSDGRGYLMDVEYTHRDPFGNGSRYWAKLGSGEYFLNRLYFSDEPGKINSETIQLSIETARKYAEERSWDIAVGQVEKALLETIE